MQHERLAGMVSLYQDHYLTQCMHHPPTIQNEETARAHRPTGDALRKDYCNRANSLPEAASIGGASQQTIMASTKQTCTTAQRSKEIFGRSSGFRKNDFFLQNVLRAYAEPVAVRSSIIRFSESKLWPFVLWLGPINIQRWTDDQTPCFEVTPASYGVGFAASPVWCSFRFELVLYFFSRWKGSTWNFSLRWNLTLPKVLPWDADIVRQASSGDVDALKGQFRANAATPLDMLPDGSTLLHVRL